MRSYVRPTNSVPLNMDATDSPVNSRFPPSTRIWAGGLATLLLCAFDFDQAGSRLLLNMGAKIAYGCLWTFIIYHSPDRHMPRMFRWFPGISIIGLLFASLTTYERLGWSVELAFTVLAFTVGGIYFERQRRLFGIPMPFSSCRESLTREP
jgi:hypothetical protein